MEKFFNIDGVDYIVSDDGHIYSTKNIGRGKYHKEISQRENEDGYMVVTVGKTGHRRVKRVHRIIAMAFVPNPDGLPEVDHIDNDKKNNHATNLQWITGFDNKSKIPFETRSICHRGTMNGRATVTEEQVREIRKRYSDGETHIHIAKDLGISQSTVYNIVKYITWKCV